MAGNTPTAVLLDFHGTIAQIEPTDESVRRAAACLEVELDPIRVTAIADAVVHAGWPSGRGPTRVRPSLAAAWANRDLSEAEHAEAFTGLVEQIWLDNPRLGFEGLAEAMYARLVAPDGWHAYADTIPMLTALRERGIKTAVVSNIGFDLRPVAKELGFDTLVDEWVLSYELGVCKPNPEIFQRACFALDVEPADALMVGDTLADAGAASIGCRTLLLPATGPGTVHGLDAVIRITERN
ncbi:hydrolase [Actinorhabdospora filicis]|uniref:Hydrolase n=1 Tax=Actinorhabdospora filicis TaxID=1785913 RepID=A0A9W6SLC0_9ACTN|nr:HAD-IA family hydrolase [Actinorhabdospora filicis]GLZ79079.1 hydrolase [Actinorhabdospora filicis]